jgi:ferredoxin
MSDVIKEEGVSFADFREETYEIFSTEKLAYKSFKIDPIVKTMDKIINLPKIKTHTLMLMTLCVKNMFGLIPGMRKVEYHLKGGHDRMIFAKMLVDFHSAIPPAINILDGIMAMEGNGPGSEGEMIKFGVILMGRNSFAVDAAAATLCGVDPYSIYTNDVYRKYMLKRADIQYAIRGDRIDGVIKKIKLPAQDLKSSVPPALYRFAKDMITTKPFFIKEKCTGCLTCVKHCPVTALRYEGKAKGIKCDYNKCIRCFVCHEICPDKAITVKQPPLAFIMGGGKKK